MRGALILGSPVIVESLLGRVGQQPPNDVADLQGAIVDLQMFVVVGGREIGRPYEKVCSPSKSIETATTPLPSGYVPGGNGEDWSLMRGERFAKAAEE